MTEPIGCSWYLFAREKWFHFVFMSCKFRSVHFLWPVLLITCNNPYYWLCWQLCDIIRIRPSPSLGVDYSSSVFLHVGGGSVCISFPCNYDKLVERITVMWFQSMMWSNCYWAAGPVFSHWCERSYGDLFMISWTSTIIRAMTNYQILVLVCSQILNSTPLFFYPFPPYFCWWSLESPWFSFHYKLQGCLHNSYTSLKV